MAGGFFCRECGSSARARLSELDADEMAVALGAVGSSGDQLARVIGTAATLRLIDDMGGVSIEFPKGKIEAGADLFEKVAASVGHSNAEKLGYAFGGDKFYIPLAKASFRRVFERRIVNEFDELTKNMSAARAVYSLVFRHKISDRTIEMIVNGSRYRKNPKATP